MAITMPLKLLGEGPLPFSVSGKEKIVSLFWNPSMIIIDSRSEGIDLFSATHAHSSYEFMVPISQMGHLRLETKTCTSEFNKILPINSEQAHGSKEYYKDCRLFSWQIDANLMNLVAYSMYGKSCVCFSNDFVPFSSELKFLFHWFLEEFSNKQAGSNFILDTIVTQTAVTLLRQVRNSCSYIGEAKVSGAKPQILKAIDFLNENFREGYSLHDVAKVANLSPYHFIRLFKAETGKTPYEYLLDVKIEKAKELLMLKKYTVTEVCFLAGFNNISHFSTLFKQKVGICPSGYSKL